MTITSAVIDALSLTKAIYNSSSPNDKYVTANIARSPNQRFSFPKYPDISTSFGYRYDKVPQILEEEGVICVKADLIWFGTGTIDLWENEKPSKLDEFAYEHGILEKGKSYCCHGTRTATHLLGLNYGPVMPGHYAVLISIEKIKSFWAKYYSEKFDKSVSTGAQIVNFKEDGQYLVINFSFGQMKFKNNEDQRTLKYFKLLLKNHAKLVTNDLAIKELGCTEEQRKNALTTLRGRISTHGLSQNIVIFTNRTSGFGIRIYPSEKPISLEITSN